MPQFYFEIRVIPNFTGFQRWESLESKIGARRSDKCAQRTETAMPLPKPRKAFQPENQTADQVRSTVFLSGWADGEIP